MYISLQVIKPIERGAFDVLILLLCGLVHPTSALRLRWDTFMMVILLSVCLVSPFVICFDVSYSHLSVLGAAFESDSFLVQLSMFQNSVIKRKYQYAQRG